ncbi:alpha- and gamma-adaptin-binding protein p34 [Entomortierella parvispora]|uniref:Alpha- and gamma-adaptin-binding protein p34 n=1 Tax=Entomortierella parvispora TaxID=205924 RepID=A0A9P3LRX3_9FUNG|nr:alpha- and gamma-adaptin-binding protein p34 [Entomortierella parvispora]
MLSSDTPPRNKILVVGRRGVGKLTLVQSILGSRFVPTTSVSKSRPSSPLILPAIPVPTLEDTVLASAEGLGHLTTTPPNGDHVNAHNAYSVFSQEAANTSLDASFAMANTSLLGASMMETARPRQDHSGVTIPWTIDTKYYSVQVDFWIDETESQGTAELERMIEAGDLDEMGTVVEAVIFCFSKNQPSTFHDIKPWLAFVERHEPSITLCVATDAPMHELSGANNATEMASSADNEYIEDYDDWCLGNGFEYIDLQEQPEDMAQDEHVGLDRILEALAAHMWDGLKRKSNKKRDQHERSMMMSFQDDDVDMGDMGSSFPGLNDQSRLYNDLEHDEDEDDDDDEDDEDDDRAFYKALAELNLQARPQSPSGLGQRSLSKQAMNILKETQIPTGSGFDDDFDELHLEQALDSVDLEDDIWSSQESSTSPNQTRGSGVTVSGRRLERQFKQYLGQPSGDETFSSTDTGGIDSSGELSDDAEYSFELDNAQDFEFGDFIVNPGPGGDELEDIDFSFGAADGMSTPKQESIKTMHNALFSNIDGDDGMAQTIAILQGLREQGKNMAENERRQLAARVALSFGMQMGE